MHCEFALTTAAGRLAKPSLGGLGVHMTSSALTTLQAPFVSITLRVAERRFTHAVLTLFSRRTHAVLGLLSCNT